MWVLYDEEPILQTSIYLAHLPQFEPTKPAEVNVEVKMCIFFSRGTKEENVSGEHLGNNLMPASSLAGFFGEIKGSYR